MSARQRAPTGKSNAAWDATTGALSARGNGGAVTRGPSPRPAMAGGEGAGGASARRGSGGISSSLAASALASLTRPLTVSQLQARIMLLSILAILIHIV